MFPTTPPSVEEASPAFRGVAPPLGPATQLSFSPPSESEPVRKPVPPEPKVLAGEPPPAPFAEPANADVASQPVETAAGIRAQMVGLPEPVFGDTPPVDTPDPRGSAPRVTSGPAGLRATLGQPPPPVSPGAQPNQTNVEPPLTVDRLQPTESMGDRRHQCDGGSPMGDLGLSARLAGFGRFQSGHSRSRRNPTGRTDPSGSPYLRAAVRRPSRPGRAVCRAHHHIRRSAADVAE